MPFETVSTTLARMLGFTQSVHGRIPILSVFGGK